MRWAALPAAFAAVLCICCPSVLAEDSGDAGKPEAASAEVAEPGAAAQEVEVLSRGDSPEAPDSEDPSSQEPSVPASVQPVGVAVADASEGAVASLSEASPGDDVAAPPVCTPDPAELGRYLTYAPRCGSDAGRTLAMWPMPGGALMRLPIGPEDRACQRHATVAFTPGQHVFPHGQQHGDPLREAHLDAYPGEAITLAPGLGRSVRDREWATALQLYPGSALRIEGAESGDLAQLASVAAHVKVLSVSGGVFSDAIDVSELPPMPCLRTLEVSATHVTGLGALSEQPSLTGLIVDAELTSHNIEALSGLERLEDLRFPVRRHRGQRLPDGLFSAHRALRRVEVAADDVQAVKGAPRLRSLIVHGDLVGDALAQIGRMTRLVELDLTLSSRTTPAELRKLRRLSRLQVLVTGSHDRRDGAAYPIAAALPRLPNLRTLVTDQPVTNRLALAVAAHGRLRNLYARPSAGDDVVLADPGLRVLDVPVDSDGGFEALVRRSHLPSLRTMTFRGGALSPDDVSALRRRDDLVSLYLDEVVLSEEAPPDLDGLTSLRFVSLDRTAWTDEALTTLRALPLLEGLSLQGGQLSAVGAQTIAQLAVEALRLTRSVLADGVLAALARGRNLERLFLGRTNTDDTGLSHFRDNPRISHLDLTATPVTNEALPVLESMPRLRRVVLCGTYVTEAAVAELQNKRPQLRIAGPRCDTAL